MRQSLRKWLPVLLILAGVFLDTVFAWNVMREMPEVRGTNIPIRGLPDQVVLLLFPCGIALIAIAMTILAYRGAGWLARPARSADPTLRSVRKDVSR